MCDTILNLKILCDNDFRINKKIIFKKKFSMLFMLVSPATLDLFHTLNGVAQVEGLD